MRPRFTLLLIVVLSFSIWASAQQQAGRTIFLVRHAEKTSTAPDAVLTPAGEKRAECLAQTLRDAGIKQIYVSDAKRTQLTAAPTAKLLNLKPTIVPAKDVSTLVRDVFYNSGGNILVVTQSDILPVVVARLQAGNITVGENDYDRLYVVTMVESSGTPVATLHYCGPSAPTPGAAGMAPPKPTPATKKGTTKKK